jgi:hypothetical protein
MTIDPSYVPLPPSGFDPVDFDDQEVDSAAPPLKMGPKAPPGYAQSGGAPITVDPKWTVEEQQALDQAREIGKTPQMPLSDQIQQGLDQSQIDALKEQCNNGQLSINDLAAELMIMMLKNAMDNKTAERQMRAELAQVQFQNGMKIADLIKQKGEGNYKKAVTHAVTQLASAVVPLLTSKIAEKALTSTKGKKHHDAGMAEEGKLTITEVTPDEVQKAAAASIGQWVASLVKTSVEVTGELISAELDLKNSIIESQTKKLESYNQIIGSVAQSVSAAIAVQVQIMQFTLSLLEKIGNLSNQSTTSVINNIRA